MAGHNTPKQVESNVTVSFLSDTWHITTFFNNDCVSVYAKQSIFYTPIVIVFRDLYLYLYLELQICSRIREQELLHNDCLCFLT